MVAVRMCTAGPSALRRKIISEGPGIGMPGAAAWASAGRVAVLLGHPVAVRVTKCRVFDRTLHGPATRIGPSSASFRFSLNKSSYRPASAVYTGLARGAPASLHSLFIAAVAPPLQARVCCRLRSAAAVSGMDIAEQNGVAAVTPNAAPHLPALCEAVLIASERRAAAMRVFADCQTGRHMSYNAPADSCASVICLHPVHRGGGVARPHQTWIKQCWQRTVLAHRIGNTAENNNRLVKPAGQPGAGFRASGSGIRPFEPLRKKFFQEVTQ